MKEIKYKGKGIHSVSELENIIEQNIEEIHQLKSNRINCVLDVEHRIHLEEQSEEMVRYRCDVCNGDISEFGNEKHERGCPEDDSPYAEFLRNGFG